MFNSFQHNKKWFAFSPPYHLFPPARLPENLSAGILLEAPCHVMSTNMKEPHLEMSDKFTEAAYLMHCHLLSELKGHMKTEFTLENFLSFFLRKRVEEYNSQDAILVLTDATTSNTVLLHVVGNSLKHPHPAFKPNLNIPQRVNLSCIWKETVGKQETAQLCLRSKAA